MLDILSHLLTREDAQDTLLLVLSDMHTGGSTALFPPYIVGDEHQQHAPFAKQMAIYAVFEEVMNYVAAKRIGRRLVIVMLGDAIEGLHHNSPQVCISSPHTQAVIHEQLMNTLMAAVNFNHTRGDRLFYVRGTEVHTHDEENIIGEHLGAEQSVNGLYVFDELTLTINGRRIVFSHHGPQRGYGANEGNALYHWLRDRYWDVQKKNTVGALPPDVVITGHYHTATYTPFSARRGNGFHVIHGIICPSFQGMTRYGYKKAPQERNEIGSVMLIVTAEGDVTVPHFILQDAPAIEIVSI